MKLAKVMGTVVSTQKMEIFRGEKFLLLQPLDENKNPIGKKLVANDIARAGVGDIVFYETGREGAYALSDSYNISDACVLGIVDMVSVG